MITPSAALFQGIVRRATIDPTFRTFKDPGAFIGDQQVPLRSERISSSYMSSGTVKFFNTEKGFGFITPDEGGKDLFVYKSGSDQELYEGDKVTFQVEQTPKGANAVNVVRS